MEPLSKIANMALNEITAGKFTNLPSLAITGLLNDFQYSWLRRFKIDYKFEFLDLARMFCSGNNKQVFKATQCKSIEDIRKVFSDYINAWCKNDDRVILSLSFDGKKINAEWVEMKEYLEFNHAVEGDTK
ncbi:MAG: hypothetical protein C0403_01965 [Desulfobacterium sp.]|nr:hypothetical protein [Desulfobacterium sp.]